LFLFLLFVHDRGVKLAADIVGRVHVGLEERAIDLVVPILGNMKRWL
jgi:hypothetical protein